MSNGPGWDPCNLAAASVLLTEVPEGQRELTVSESIPPLPDFSWEVGQPLGGSCPIVGESLLEAMWCRRRNEGSGLAQTQPIHWLTAGDPTSLNFEFPIIKIGIMDHSSYGHGEDEKGLLLINAWHMEIAQ